MLVLSNSHLNYKFLQAHIAISLHISYIQ